MFYRNPPRSGSKGAYRHKLSSGAGKSSAGGYQRLAINKATWMRRRKTAEANRTGDRKSQN
ncbi:hypothetical protein DSM3645_26859 [Blastopirellula marina DSM 3645]|uniref:Uncharacterized protein n=1 Tax=Blastopirellula marina DSM 3645 TaxID=314230 RepID=A3ZY97_9BACT|nr:hypothetical protein DSM3645_26859 [Blastopirellula marina DSM 3645]